MKQANGEMDSELNQLLGNNIAQGKWKLKLPGNQARITCPKINLVQEIKLNIVTSIASSGPTKCIYWSH